jgi:hypothetical protein
MSSHHTRKKITRSFSILAITTLAISFTSIFPSGSAQACGCFAPRVDPAAVYVYQSGSANQSNEAQEEEKYQVRKEAGMEQDDHGTGSSNKSQLSGNPRSSRDLQNDIGETQTRRYYDKTGKADEDIDYTNHNTPKAHPKVPHRHKWDWSTGRPERGGQF